ncbi:MAG: tetratricopeptide repeat protein [Verrucomicrobia bacterium]|nr:tetratricopeptide repeat protein [Verrucomicrobiota bacterium]MCH8511402.1 tetratricopeptide repeat protein [Kiritimatiellia bacterium]
MRARFPILISFFLLAGWVTSGAEVSALIEQLGADAFADREAASAALWEKGDAALEALRSATTNSDPEVSTRARNLLPLMEMGIRPDTPKARRQAMLESRTLSGSPLRELIKEIYEELGKEAFPFLRVHLQGEGSNIATDLIIDHLKSLFRDQRYQELKDRAAASAERAPHEARFLYLKATGAGFMQEEELAHDLCQQAFALNPDDEVAHYLAAELLRELNQVRLAIREYHHVLETPPDKSVYDINAYLRLGSLYERTEEYKKAAFALQSALALYEDGRKEGNRAMGLVGNTVEGLQDKIRELQAQAIAGEMGETPFRVRVETVVKDGREEELAAARRESDLVMSMSVQPHGLRLFEKAPATVAYDAEQNQIQVLLNDRPIQAGVAYKLKPDRNRIQIHTLDRVYFFELDADTGQGRKVDSFALDYLLKITPNEQTAALKDPELLLDETPVSWEELEQGIHYDFLPKKINFSLSGKNANGIVYKAEAEFEPQAQ